MSALIFKIALIGAAGIGAQWLAWSLRIPAIALLLIAGFFLGPATGLLDPQQDFGEVYRPMIALAVAIILFEGGLTLNFKEIRETSTGVRRIIVTGGPLVWLMSALAAHYAAGLSWPVALVLGAILVVTGPTVIMPLLRSARLGARPASLLRWEAIVNDPIGALFAVIAFEIYLVIHGSHDALSLIGSLALGAVVAVVGGYVAARALGGAFIRGMVPEFLKSPVVLASVLLVYALSDMVLEESGLLTVTVMGITLANLRLASLTEMRRFKETVTVLLVSGLFILLTASLDLQALYDLGWQAALFVFLILFVVRPLALFIATIGTGLSIQERTLVAWIAPRGIVAVAVSGLFASALMDLGVEDANRMLALTFAVVASTIVLHGFSLAPLAGFLDLKSAAKPGILIVGGSPWSHALAAKLQQAEIPTLIADSNWNHIRDARLQDLPVYYGEVLADAAHHTIEFNRFTHLIAATDNDAYNSLICSEFGPEMGRGNVYQTGKVREDSERNSLAITVGGRPLFKPERDHSELQRQLQAGWVFQATKLSDAFSFDDYLEAQGEDTALLFWKKENGDFVFQQHRAENLPAPGHILIAFGPPSSENRQTAGGPGKD